MADFKSSLFGDHSFLEFTLQDNTIEGCPAMTIDNNVRVELWDNGILYFHPQDDLALNSILLSVGVHGNETAPIEIIDQLVREIFSGKIPVKHNLLVVIANPKAIAKNCRQCDENMNRLFSQDSMPNSNSSDECVRCHRLMIHSQIFFQRAKAQKIHYDLHTAIRGSVYKQFAISPNSIASPATEYQYELLGQWGIQAILSTQQKSSTYSAFTARVCGATSFTLELGQVKPFGENNVDEFASIISGLTALISDTRDLTILPSIVERFSVVGEVAKQTESFRLCFSEDTVNFTEFQKGDILAIDHNYQYVVSANGERILFPNENVAIGQRALVIVQSEDNIKASIL